MDLSEAEIEAREQAREETQGAMSRSLVLVSSKAATWALAFVMTVMMPRYLGATGFGRLYLAMSLTGIMAILVEFGLNSLVAREVSRSREDATRYLINAGAIKAALWVVAFGVLAVVCKIVNYPVQTQIATAILAVSVLFTAEESLLQAVLQANDRIRWIAIGTFIEKMIYVGLGVGALMLGFGILAVSVTMLLSTAVGFGLSLTWFILLGRQSDVRTGWRGIEVKDLFVRALPFFSVLFFGAIYFRVDVIILSLFKPDAVVGYYGAAYRLFQTTYIIPDAFVFALFPLFCRLSSQRGEGLVVASQKSLDLLLLVALPIAAGMCTLSDEIITTLYGAHRYAESIPVLRILSLAIVLMYANGVFVQLLIATERQKRLATTAVIAALFNVTANLILIPPFGAIGAASTTVATEVVVLALNYSFLPRTVTSQLRYTTAGKALVASLAMAAVLTAISGLNLLLLIPLGALVYLGGILLLKAVPAEDWAMMRSAVANLRSA